MSAWLQNLGEGIFGGCDNNFNLIIILIAIFIGFSLSRIGSLCKIQEFAQHGTNNFVPFVHRCFPKSRKMSISYCSMFLKAPSDGIFGVALPLRDYAPFRTSAKDVQYESTFLTVMTLGLSPRMPSRNNVT